jgi:hypothetical protein
MEYSKANLDKLMKEYLDESIAYGDDDTDIIQETLLSFKPVLLESNLQLINESKLQEYSNTLQGVPKDIFDDFILYAFADEDNKLV